MIFLIAHNPLHFDIRHWAFDIRYSFPSSSFPVHHSSFLLDPTPSPLYPPQMLPDLQSSVLCDDVRQERNGKFILIGLFDILSVPSFPAILARVCIVNRWCCGEGNFNQHSRILMSDGNTVLVEGKTVQVNLQDNESTATSVEFFINVKIAAPGTYWVEILLEGDLKVRYPLKIHLLKKQEQ
jgi:hypothetical protein